MKQKFYLLLLLCLLSSSVFSQTIPSYVPTNGLIAYWPFNGNANDESGNGNHGTVNGATLTSDRNGVQGKAYSFACNSVNANINTTSVTTQLTLSFWYYRQTQGCIGPRVMEFSQGSNLPGELMIEENYPNGLRIGHVTSAGLNNVLGWMQFNSLLNQTWNFYVYTNNGSVAKIYQNGILINQYNSPGNPVLDGNVAFGWMNHPANDGVNGKLDDIAIYNRALTQAEITALYNGPTYTINASSGSNGSITPSGITTLNSTATQRYTFTANSGYMLDSVIVDGNKVDSVSGYTFSALTSNHTIRITYKALNIPSYVPTNGLVGWWPFNGNANDESGNGNHGTVNGAILTSDRNGNLNKGFSFERSFPNEINLKNSMSFNNLANITISLWVNLKSYNQIGESGYNHYINKSDQNNNHHFVFANNSTQLYFYFGGGSNGFTTNNLPKLNTWSNLIVTYNYNGTPNSYCKFYINGSIVDSMITSQILNMTTDDIRIGSFGSSTYNRIDGSLDDIAIYNRALTQQEITALYTGVVTKDIVASSSANGSISPSGSTSVNSGSSQTYTFTPNPGYWIDSVIVNGVQVPTASSYTFNNVTSNQTIRVTYRSLAAALAAANICSNDTIVSTVNLPAQSLVRATRYYSNIYLFNQNNTSNAFKYNVNDRKYTAIADKPTACIECGVAEASGKIYCFNTNGTSEAYDIASNTWLTQTNQTSTSNSSVYAASINNKIYILGTNNNQNTFTQYNPQTNSYTPLANPTINATQSMLVAFNNKLYKIGGADNNSQPISSVEVYNPTNNTWTAMPDLPVALTQVGATYYDNKLYVFGGKQSNNINSNKVYVFDFTSNAWYAESNTQNTNRTNIEAKTANNMVFLFGGTDSSNTTTNQAQRYFCKDQLCTCKWAEYVCNGVSSDVPCNTLSPSIQTLRQDTTANTGNLYNGTASNNVTVTLNYTGANGAAYNARNINSTGVTGLTATLAAGTLNNGNGSLILSISGTSNTTGTANFSISIGGKTCVFTRVVKAMLYKAGTVFCSGTPTEVVELTDPLTGMVWMDRNLGASRAAISSDDSLAYGDLYQWGRGADGHQCRNSATTTTLSTTDQPGHNKFIVQLSQTWPFDWQSIPNFNLWQGTEGKNNPCPIGFRVPNNFEFQKLIQSWVLNGNLPNGPVNAPLPIKLVLSGIKSFENGSISDESNLGSYWTSSTYVFPADIISVLHIALSYTFNNGNGTIDDYPFRTGLSVRCIKDLNNSNIGNINTLDLDSSFTDQYTTQELYRNFENLTRFRLKYSGGNGGVYPSQIIQSTGVNGLTAIINSDTLANGNGYIVFYINGVTIDTGYASFNITIAGKSTTFKIRIKEPIGKYRLGTVHCPGIAEIIDVVNPITGKTWMDRNLGAGRKSTSLSDNYASGELYQWGRGADGHQCRNSSTLNTLSTSDQPAHPNFILTSTNPFDWKDSKNDSLWQGVNGINNPCPYGYRLPTSNEFGIEMSNWITNNSNGAYFSPLKFNMGGYRFPVDGSINQFGVVGEYWTSTINGNNVNTLRFHNTSAYISSNSRSNGLSVRCIKD